MASHPRAADARAYFDSWVEFYQDFHQFPADLPVDIDHGFDTYKVTYCTVDVAPPGKRRPAPTAATGNVSVPRKAGPLDTVAYLHGTSVSFYNYIAPDYLGLGDSTVPPLLLRRHRGVVGRRPARGLA